MKHAQRIAETSFSITEQRHIRHWGQLCLAERHRQMHDSLVFGKNLVKVIAQCAKNEVTIDADMRLQLDQDFFGEPTRGVKPLAEDAVSGDRSSMTHNERLALQRSQVDAAIKRPEHGWSQPRDAHDLRDEEWWKAYRAFLRKRIVLSDGRRVPFRLVAAGTGKARRKLMRKRGYESYKESEASCTREAALMGDADASTYVPIA